MNRPELLLPAGSMDVLKTAIRYGADAVYIGGEAFSLRAMAKNFSSAEMREAVDFAHQNGKKIYVTANILAHNADLPEAENYFSELKEIRPDALIISDPGIFEIEKKICPEIPVHISTQANNTNYGTFLFWYRLGVKRIVTARELSLREIREIRDRIPADMEIETFVHGAMCISYSGRCLLSNFLTGRDANRGACTHPCRWTYSVVEETRPGQYMPVYENERGTYIFNSKDLCMAGHIPELIDAGIDSFKIEGRMKTALYVATAARAYRRAIDDCRKNPEEYAKRRRYYEEETQKGTWRDYTTGFFFGKPSADAQITDSNTYRKNYAYIGTAEYTDEAGYAHFEQKNKFSTGDILEIMKPDGRDVLSEVQDIMNEDGIRQESAPHPKQALSVRMSPLPEPGDIIRKKEEPEE
jgi:putative protease